VFVHDLLKEVTYLPGSPLWGYKTLSRYFIGSGRPLAVLPDPVAHWHKTIAFSGNYTAAFLSSADALNL